MTALNDPYQKTCKYMSCRKLFTAKRLNQEFCCNECKKKENNGKAAVFRKLVKKIDAQHKLNRKILEAFYLVGKIEVNIEELLRNGFDHSKPTGLSKEKINRAGIPEFYNYSLEHLILNQYKISKLW